MNGCSGYRGVTEAQAIGNFDASLQRLYLEFSKEKHEDWHSIQTILTGREFFRPGPLMRALECERSCVLLIDELDKVDDGFEAMLLEILSAGSLRSCTWMNARACSDAAVQPRLMLSRQKSCRRFLPSGTV